MEMWFEDLSPAGIAGSQEVQVVIGIIRADAAIGAGKMGKKVEVGTAILNRQGFELTVEVLNALCVASLAWKNGLHKHTRLRCLASHTLEDFLISF